MKTARDRLDPFFLLGQTDGIDHQPEGIDTDWTLIALLGIRALLAIALAIENAEPRYWPTDEGAN